ncbi:MGDG synthase family glycosyltransferase [Alkalibacter saccharofermentans]|uniref:Processive 1,2-diacylglycerol beta-glucosyltransferase n=1 Tax=Alkalibacter saccharofermentans DSM 14828 TaxID=1120975 RepID=A0A1M4XMZ4_9FIRM|nr:glycosyltransferase [Alkalibacter saccharofermentans]SHE94746.1 processive 1,2-diacylglycerol beta-glucosyltransferase [Alkalibacter saccharofermentans DSM 14828]
MKKVLIFTASTGGGHNIAANSLKEHFEASGYEAAIFDAFKETNLLLDKVISRGYEKILSLSPRTYGRMYRAANNKTLSHYIVALITDVMEKNMMGIINENNPDLIIATHPLVTNVLGTLKEDREFDVPIISIVTDYMIHRAYIHDQIDAYVAGSEYTKETIIKKGVDEKKIHTYGIPVRKSFLDHTTIAVKDYSVDLSVLLMAGSMGTAHMEKAFLSLISSKHNLKIIVVCGKNDKVKSRIDKIMEDEHLNKIVEVYGFVENIPELMDRGDVIITKPGGLTTTESIIKNIPMIIPYYIPGQEEENTDFLVETGMAIKVDKIKDLTNVVDYLVHNKDILDSMAQNMSEMAKEQSIDRIIALGSELIAKNIEGKYKNKTLVMPS